MKELPLKEDATKATIDFLERQGYSVLKWVEFDADNESTWPLDDEIVLTQSHQTLWFDGFEVEWKSDATYSIDSVTHWCELPQRKESK